MAACHQWIISHHKLIFLSLALPVYPRHAHSGRRVHVGHVACTCTCLHYTVHADCPLYFLQPLTSFLICCNMLPINAPRWHARCLVVIAVPQLRRVLAAPLRVNCTASKLLLQKQTMWRCFPLIMLAERCHNLLDANIAQLTRILTLLFPMLADGFILHAHRL